MHVGAQSRGLRAPCERVAPWVTPGPRITRVRLAADLGRMGLDTHRVSNKVSKITSRHLVPLDRAFPAHALLHEDPAGVGRFGPYFPYPSAGATLQGMKSKIHPTHKTKCRVANWPAYNQALVRRGDVTVWLSAEAIAACLPRRSGRRGRQLQYSDLARGLLRRRGRTPAAGRVIKCVRGALARDPSAARVAHRGGDPVGHGVLPRRRAVTDQR